MADLYFDADADAALTSLEADPDRARLPARVQEVLEALEADPGQAWLRRHRFQTVDLWCVMVAGDDEEWAVLVEPSPQREGDVWVQYLGPASFT